jgi:hypothetical protein
MNFSRETKKKSHPIELLASKLYYYCIYRSRKSETENIGFEERNLVQTPWTGLGFRRQLYSYYYRV